MYLRIKRICDELGITCENEVTIDDYELIYSDIAIKDKKLIIEVEGNHHFLYGDLSKKLGYDMYLRSVIKGLGYTIRDLNY